MKRAYEMLGLRAHHGFEMDSWDDYPGLELAAEATWPSVPGARKPVPPPFTSADWDRLFPNYDVVVVQRDFDAWWASFASAVLSKDIPGNPLALALALVHALYRAAGTRVFDAVSKMVNGAFGTQSYRDITTEKARAFYDAYYDRIRQMVPAERRLEYSLSQGWEPLCRCAASSTSPSQMRHSPASTTVARCSAGRWVNSGGSCPRPGATCCLTFSEGPALRFPSGCIASPSSRGGRVERGRKPLIGCSASAGVR
jgi:hypothetical protein